MSKFHSASLRAVTFFCFAAFASASGGCTTEADDTVSPRIQVTDRSRSALTASGITALNGVYSGDCSGRTNGDPWSVAVSGSPSLAHSALSVRKNDGDCDLTITEVVVGAATYAGTPDIGLAVTYAGSASAFKDAPEDPVAFYANAKISALDFGDDFTIDLLVSDNPNDDASGSKQGAFATHSSTVEANNVDAPSYTIALASFTLDTDADDEVSSVDGYAQLALANGATAGQTYAIHHGTLDGSATQEDLAAAYTAAAVSGTLALLTDLQLPATSFDIVGEDLTESPAIRTVIIRNVEASVVSYQLIAVTFSKP